MISWKDFVGPVFDRVFGGSKEKYNAEAAKYNREVDIATLQLGLRRFGHELELNDQGILDAQFRAGVAQRGVDQAVAEAATEQLRRVYLRDVSESEALQTEALARGRFDISALQTRVRQAQVSMEASVDRETRNVLAAEAARDDRLFDAAALVRGERSQQLDVMARAARDVYGAGVATRQARTGRIGAAERRLDVGERQQQRTQRAERGVLGARRGTVGAEALALAGTTQAGLGAIGTQRAATRLGGQVGRQALMEGRDDAIGGALVQSAARGVRGSSSAVAEAEAREAYRKELVLQQAEESTAMAGLARSEAEIQGRARVGGARTGQAITELDRDRAVLDRRGAEYAADLAVSRADLSVGRAEIGEAGVRARSEYAVGEAGRDVERQRLAYEAEDSETGRLLARAQRGRARAELRGREGVRLWQTDLAESEYAMAETERDARFEEAAMRRRRGLVEVADSEDREGRLEIQGLDAETRRRRELMTQDELDRDNDMVRLEVEFAKWQLKRLPSLPPAAAMRNERFIRDVLSNMGSR